MSDRYNVAIMGATGAVGQIFLELLAERDFPIDELRLLASSRSVGTELNCGERSVKVQELTRDSFDGIDIVLSSAGGDISKEFVPAAVAAGSRLSKRNNTNTQQTCAFNFKSVFTILVFYEHDRKQIRGSRHFHSVIASLSSSQRRKSLAISSTPSCSAQSSGVRPSPAFAFTCAPLASSNSAISLCPQ